MIDTAGHGFVEGIRYGMYIAVVAFDISTLDGQTVRYPVRLLYWDVLEDRSYGTEFMLSVFERSALCKLATPVCCGNKSLGSLLFQRLRQEWTKSSCAAS